jgi:hypothetical protein
LEEQQQRVVLMVVLVVVLVQPLVYVKINHPTATPVTAVTLALALMLHCQMH